MTPHPTIWSTDHIPPRERFEHWRELRAKNVFGVTIEIDKDAQADFNGQVAAIAVGGATLVEMHATSYKVERSDADIARSPGDALCIYQQLDGGGWFTAGGTEFVVSAGQLATSHSDFPYATQPTTEAGFHLRLVKIPFACCSGLIERPRDLTAMPLRAAPGLTALFASYFDAFVREAPNLDGPAAEVAVQSLAQLALVARGLSSPRTETARDAVRAGLLQQARRIIDADFPHAALSPAEAAHRLGISVRQLHLLFEPTGTTFARHLQARRLQHARLLLAQSDRRSVADVAFACGFDSLSTFYRGFRAAFDCSPADFRASTK